MKCVVTFKPVVKPSATHIWGHTLDLIMFKGVNVFSVSACDVALSDHCCNFFEMNPNPVRVNSVKKKLSRNSICLQAQLISLLPNLVVL